MTPLAPLATVVKHATRGVLIDANILILLAIGTFTESLIESHKRTRQYTIEDFRWLQNFVSNFQKVIVTPHILAEVSNLSIPSKSDQPRSHVPTVLAVLRETRELYVEKDCILAEEYVARLGVTDAGIIKLAREQDYLVLTDDRPLTICLQQTGCDVVNLNDVRTALWQLG